MSRSSNVRSRYQHSPRYVRMSIAQRDASIKKRSRDERANEKHEIRAILESIHEDTDEDWKWWL